LLGARPGDLRRHSDRLWRIFVDTDAENHANSSDRFQHGDSNGEVTFARHPRRASYFWRRQSPPHQGPASGETLIERGSFCFKEVTDLNLDLIARRAREEEQRELEQETVTFI
jgi:hypothetical protein